MTLEIQNYIYTCVRKWQYILQLDFITVMDKPVKWTF